jgi:hypothetical protein
MKKTLILLLLVLGIPSVKMAQSQTPDSEFGISTGGLTNFPANKNYMKTDINVLYVTPYVRVGHHEFSAGVLCPLTAHSLYNPDTYIHPRPGAIAQYKFFIDIDPLENFFIHYAFQYIRFSREFTDQYVYEFGKATEKDMYINNLIGLGYTLYFDQGHRFGFYYIFDYVISQASYKVDHSSDSKYWETRFIWNNLSTHVGFSFKITPLKKGK